VNGLQFKNSTLFSGNTFSVDVANVRNPEQPRDVKLSVDVISSGLVIASSNFSIPSSVFFDKLKATVRLDANSQQF
jgi:hypothetical protein